jgi:ABC-2 type transport system permease protein
MSTRPALADDRLRAALSTGPRPSRPSGLSASLVFAWRSLLKVKHVPEQLGDVLAIPIVFTLLFTYLFGGAVAGSTAEYLRFLLPGTLVMTVLLLTMYTGIGLNADIATGVFDRYRSLPIWRPAPIIGALLGDIGRYLTASAIVLGLGWTMGYRPEAGPGSVLSALGLILVFSFGLSWVWTTLGLVMRTPSAVMNLGTVVLFPLTLASNAFVDPDTTPGWLQAFIRVNPVTHLVTAVRGLTDGTATEADIAWVLVAAAALVVLFAPLTMHLYRTRG